MEKDKPMHVVLFTSRNKDNKHLEGFEERTRTFLSRKTCEELNDVFDSFAKKGVPGELSRFYRTLNARSDEKTKLALMHFMLDNDIDLCRMDTKLSSLAQLSKNASEKKWLFDYDDDKEKLAEFLFDMRMHAGEPVVIEHYDTPNGYVVTASRGFDTRRLLRKWKNVTLKRDGMLCVEWKNRDDFA